MCMPYDVIKDLMDDAVKVSLESLLEEFIPGILKIGCEVLVRVAYGKS